MFLHVYCRCFRVVDPRIAQKPPDWLFFQISIKFEYARKNILKFFKNHPLFWPLNLNLFPKAVVLIFNKSGCGRHLGGKISKWGFEVHTITLRCAFRHESDINGFMGSHLGSVRKKVNFWNPIQSQPLDRFFWVFYSKVADCFVVHLVVRIKKYYPRGDPYSKQYLLWKWFSIILLNWP